MRTVESRPSSHTTQLNRTGTPFFQLKASQEGLLGSTTSQSPFFQPAVSSGHYPANLIQARPSIAQFSSRYQGGAGTLVDRVEQQADETQPDLQLSRLRDYRDRAGYEPTDSEVEATNEYLAYTNDRYVWQTELALTPNEARLACRLILDAMQSGETVNWQRKAREFALEARRQLSNRATPEPIEEESPEPEEETTKICGPDITSWLVAQMRANGSGAVAIYLRMLNDSWDPVEWGKALVIWWYLVRTGGEWDFKTILGRGLTEQFPDCRQNCTGRLWSITLKGECMTYEAPANIHYGYVGRMAGFSESRLLSGAADAQAREGRGETADDPRDVEAIRVGFRLFDQQDPNAFAANDLSANHYDNLSEEDGDPEDCEACSSAYNG